MRFFRLSVLLSALVMLVAVAARPASAQTIDDPARVRGAESPSEMWRTIRQGAQGEVSNPAQTGWLIKPSGVGCTEMAVGFSSPVHSKMPPLATEGGVGMTREALLLLAGVFGVSFGAGAMLARNLGKPASEA